MASFRKETQNGDISIFLTIWGGGNIMQTINVYFHYLFCSSELNLILLGVLLSVSLVNELMYNIFFLKTDILAMPLLTCKERL